MVDEKYYLSDRIVETFLRRNKIPNNHMQFYVMDKGGGGENGNGENASRSD